MKFNTEFNIGEKVTYKYSMTKGVDITCPFCDGKGFVEHDGDKLPCKSCQGTGRYIKQSTKKIWSEVMDVVGVVIEHCFDMVDNKITLRPKTMICVAKNMYNFCGIEYYPEEDVIFADEAEAGDPAEEI